jgi:hypothetical protein
MQTVFIDHTAKQHSQVGRHGQAAITGLHNTSQLKQSMPTTKTKLMTYDTVTLGCSEYNTESNLTSL